MCTIKTEEWISRLPIPVQGIQDQICSMSILGFRAYFLDRKINEKR